MAWNDVIIYELMIQCVLIAIDNNINDLGINTNLSTAFRWIHLSLPKTYNITSNSITTIKKYQEQIISHNSHPFIAIHSYVPGGMIKAYIQLAPDITAIKCIRFVQSHPSMMTQVAQSKPPLVVVVKGWKQRSWRIMKDEQLLTASVRRMLTHCYFWRIRAEEAWWHGGIIIVCILVFVLL